MRTIARRVTTLLADPWSGVSVILGVVVGALFGGLYDTRASTQAVSAHRGGLYPGDRDD